MRKTPMGDPNKKEIGERVGLRGQLKWTNPRNPVRSRLSFCPCMFRKNSVSAGEQKIEHGERRIETLPKKGAVLLGRGKIKTTKEKPFYEYTPPLQKEKK